MDFQQRNTNFSGFINIYIYYLSKLNLSIFNIYILISSISKMTTETELCSVIYCTHTGASTRGSLYQFISEREINYVYAMS